MLLQPSWFIGAIESLHLNIIRNMYVFNVFSQRRLVKSKTRSYKLISTLTKDKHLYIPESKAALNWACFATM